MQHQNTVYVYFSTGADKETLKITFTGKSAECVTNGNSVNGGRMNKAGVRAGLALCLTLIPPTGAPTPQRYSLSHISQVTIRLLRFCQ